MQNWILGTLLYHYDNFYNFWTTFAASIEWEKEISEKNIWKNTKLLAKLSRDVKQRVLIVKGTGYPVLQFREKNQTFAIVKGGKVDFSFLIIRSNRGC